MKRHFDRIFLLALFAANLALIWPFLRTDFGPQPWNNDYIYIGTAHMFRNYPWTWNPLQYGGVPFAYMYQPLFYLWILAMPAASLGHAYHLASGLGYAVVPVAVFVLARTLFQSRAAAAFAGFAYSFLPSFVVFLFPGWLPPNGLGFRFAPWGFTALVAYHEVPHTISLALIMFAVAAAWRNRFVLATLLAAAVFLLNWPGSIGLLIALAALAIARQAALMPIVSLVGTAYGLSAFWMTPGFFASVWLLNRVILRHEFAQYDAPWPHKAWLILAAGFLCILPAFWKLIPPAFAFLIALSVICLTVVTGLALTNVHFLPLPNRYVLEANAAVILIFAGCISRIPRRRAWIGSGAILTGLFLAVPFYQQAWPLQGSSIDPQSTIAFQASQWINQNANNQRVFSTGEEEGDLNLWTSAPQVGGSHNGISNFLVVAAQKQIADGCGDNAGDLAQLWLRALAAPYAIVHEGASREAFHTLADPQKFAQLPVTWTNHSGDTIYRLPDPPIQQAVVVDLDEMSALPPLTSTTDVDFLRRYNAWAQGKRTAQIRWTRPDRAEIDAALAPNEALLLKINYDPGWSASRATLSRDPINFLLIRPGPGEHSIALRYGASWDVWLGRGLTLLTIVAMLIRPRSRALAFAPGIIAVLAFVWLLSHPQRGIQVAESTFRDLHPPRINAQGIVPGEVMSVYGTDFTANGAPVRVWIGTREAKTRYISSQLIQFDWPSESGSSELLQIESNGCRGNTFLTHRR